MTDTPLFPTPRSRSAVPFGLLIYVAVLFGLRLVLFPGASEDDGEALYYAQSWALTYKTSQPPLYSWLLLGLMNLTGLALNAALFLKFSLLALFHVFAHLAARRIFRDDGFALLVSLGLISCWVIGWDMVVNYSHTLLVATAMAATLWALARLDEDPTWRGHLILALAIAVGLSAKFNFALFVVPLLIAALLDRSFRAHLLRPAAVWLVVMACIAFLPIVLGVTTSDQSVSSMNLPSAGSEHWVAALTGLGQLILSSLGFLMPFLMFALIFGFRAFGRLTYPDEVSRRWACLLERFMIGVAIAFVGAIVAGGLNDVRNNWLIVWFPAVFYVLLRLKFAGLPVRRLRFLLGAMALLAMAAPVGLGVRAATAPETCRKCNFFVPYGALATELQNRGVAPGTILAHDFPNQLAGNLRRAFPDVQVLSTRWRDYTPPPRGQAAGSCLLIWRVHGANQGEAQVRNRAAELGIAMTVEIDPIEITLPIPGSAARSMTWRYLNLEPRPGCR